MTTTRANLDLQSDLKQPNVPAVPDDVANKQYVDAAVSGSVPDATSAPGGGVVGKLTVDSSLGVEVLPGVRLGVKVDGTTTQFNGSGEIEATAGAVPDATAAPGGGVIGKSTFDSNLGLDVTLGVARVKVDGASVQFNGSGQLNVPDATSGSGGAIKGKSTFDSDRGLAVTAGVVGVKPDLATLQFNPSGELEVIGGGGGSTGPISFEVPYTRNIPSVTPVTPIVLGTQVSAVSYPKGAGTTGERFEFQVADDYFAGSLEVLVVYRMSSAVATPNNQIRVSTQAEIVNVTTGAIDGASYPETPVNYPVPNNSTIYVRQTILTLIDGDFGRGDTITVAIKRISGDVDDLHTGDWQVVAYEIRYTGILDSRITTQTTEFFSNAPAETAALPITLGTLIDAVVLPSAADAGVKLSFIVPETWDGFSDALVYVSYAMSSAAVGTVRLNTYGEVVDVVTGAISTIPSADFDFNPPVSTNVTRAIILSVPAALLQKGNYISLVIARRTAVGGNHTGDLHLISSQTTFTLAPVAGYTAVEITQDYLAGPAYGNQVGSVSTDADYPLFGSTFEALFRAASTSAAGRVDAAFSGRLSAIQTQIAELRIAVMLGAGASPEYRLRVYAEGSGGTPVYDSLLQPAPGSLTELVVTAGMLSAQPTGSKRYHVVVEAYIDAGEALLFGRPFVRQE